MIDNYSCTSPPLTHPIFNLVYWSHCYFGANSWDTRGNGGAVKPTSRVQAHEAEVNAVAFAPHNENILITGSADKVRFPQVILTWISSEILITCSTSSPTDCRTMGSPQPQTQTSHVRITHGRSPLPRVVPYERNDFRISIRRPPDQLVGRLQDWIGTNSGRSRGRSTRIDVCSWRSHVETYGFELEFEWGLDSFNCCRGESYAFPWFYLYLVRVLMMLEDVALGQRFASLETIEYALQSWWGSCRGDWTRVDNRELEAFVL